MSEQATQHDGGCCAQVESVDALILEQRDLTFGKRASTLAIWRTAKAHKRLRRLIELCGVKCLTLEPFSWAQKEAAFMTVRASARQSYLILTPCVSSP